MHSFGAKPKIQYAEFCVTKSSASFYRIVQSTVYFDRPVVNHKNVTDRQITNLYSSNQKVLRYNVCTKQVGIDHLRWQSLDLSLAKCDGISCCIKIWKMSVFQTSESKQYTVYYCDSSTKKNYCQIFAIFQTFSNVTGSQCIAHVTRLLSCSFMYWISLNQKTVHE